MIRLSNLADYAVVVMTAIAARSDTLSAAADVAETTALPQTTVSKVMGKLARAGLLVSHRGVRGGFSLARPADEICVADMIEAVDGPIALTNCIEHASGDCSLTQICGLKPHWQVMNVAVRQAFEAVSLRDLMAPHSAVQMNRIEAPQHAAQG